LKPQISAPICQTEPETQQIYTAETSAKAPNLNKKNPGFESKFPD